MTGEVSAMGIWWELGMSQFSGAVLALIGIPSGGLVTQNVQDITLFYLSD